MTRPFPAHPVMSEEELSRHVCERHERWAEHDAQGIFLCFVCTKCANAKLARYRPEILSGYTQEDVDEPIEPDW
jgi:hypothetical protein